MRLFEIIIPFALLTSSTFGINNNTSCNINVVPNKFDYSHLKLEHQISYQTLHDQVFLYDFVYKPYLDKSHHFESVLGARQFFGDFGIGLNMGYAANNNSGYFGHQLNYGLEFFYSRLQLSLNQYEPLFPVFKSRNSVIKFPSVSELGITYKPSSKYEFGIYPYFVHSIDKWGAKGRASIFISNIIELEISPFYKSQNSGICFSIGYHFGGPKSRKNQAIRKSHEMYFNSQPVKPKSVKLDLINKLIPPSECLPVVVPPVIEEKPIEIPIKDIPVIEPVKQPEDVPAPPVDQPRPWGGFFFKG